MLLRFSRSNDGSCVSGGAWTRSNIPLRSAGRPCWARRIKNPSPASAHRSLHAAASSRPQVPHRPSPGQDRRTQLHPPVTARSRSSTCPNFPSHLCQRHEPVGVDQPVGHRAGDQHYLRCYWLGHLGGGGRHAGGGGRLGEIGVDGSGFGVCWRRAQRVRPPDASMKRAISATPWPARMLANR